MLKQAIRRENIGEKVDLGYRVQGVFCCNAPLNKDGKDYLEMTQGLIVYDANRIADEYVDIDKKSGIEENFDFDVSDSEVIKYQTAKHVLARIFLASALQMTKMNGISNQELFSHNVRLALGNTKVNKSLVESVKNHEEHKNFPLYHNGITVLCNSINESVPDRLRIKNYVVVNGAQSLTSLLNSKASISQDLKILTKVVALGENDELTEKITHNSNNQNAIKPRDQKSNNIIQLRLKKEVEDLKFNSTVLEVKSGEINSGKNVLDNKLAGLDLLAIDLGKPWACHQKHKVMTTSYTDIFNRSDVTGAKLIFCQKLLYCVDATLDGFDDKVFGYYNLTRFFVAHSVAEMFKDDLKTKLIFQNPKKLFEGGKINQFVEQFQKFAEAAVDDLNYEVSELVDQKTFDHKRDLKSPNWCKSMTRKLVTTYRKDVKRKKIASVSESVADII